MLKLIMLKHAPYGVIKALQMIRANFFLLCAKNNLIANLSRKIVLTKVKYMVSMPNSEAYFNAPIRWLKSFEEYGTRSNNTIKLVWVDGPVPGNFGDWLSPYIISKISGRGIVHAAEYVSHESRHLVAVGSVAVLANKYSYVMGSGISSLKDKLSPDAKYCFVRGLYTKTRVLQCGGKVSNEVMGDLGFILKCIYTPKIQKNTKGPLFVRHITHKSLDIVLPNCFREIDVAISSSSDIENFIDEINASSYVVTSAMHCYIACKSYGINCALVRFESAHHQVYGDGIKYLDAMEGVGLNSYSPHLIPLDLNKSNFKDVMDCNNVSPEVIADLYNFAVSSVIEFIRE